MGACENKKRDKNYYLKEFGGCREERRATKETVWWVLTHQDIDEVLIPKNGIHMGTRPLAFTLIGALASLFMSLG